ncbi:MAG: hypothetical protein ACR2KP_05420 [Egibacteraceae bacterium]
MIFPWYVLGLLFVAPFVDLRRPLRLLHLDLAVLLAAGFGPLYAYVRFEQPRGSIVLAVAGLAYLAARLLRSGFRPPARPGRLVPVLGLKWLAVALVIVLAGRVAYLVADDQPVHDVGLASVAGADRIADGDPLYDDRLDRDFFHFDSYGPATYLSYVPFEQALPWNGAPVTSPEYENPAAARAAAVTFDLLVVLCLLLLGGRLRSGSDGRLLGVALAYAWASYPYTLLVLRHSFNDALVALLVLLAVLAVPHAAGRGAAAALATATKFGPAVIAPILATGTGERRARSWMVFGASFGLVTLAAFGPLVPDGGLEELYRRTLGYQQDRPGYNSLWARFPGLDGVQLLAQGAAVALALGLAVVPRRRTFVQIIALAAAVLVAVQLTIGYWVSAYLVWFAPLAFAALFTAHDCSPRAPAASPRPA